MERPWISANFAITWDGRISTRRGTPSDFSSKADKARFLEIRAEADAVLVTVKTAATDRMTMRIPSPALRAQRRARGQRPHPLRVLISNSGKVPLTLSLWEKKVAPVLVFSTEAMPARTRRELAKRAEVRLTAGPAVDLAAMARVLGDEHGVQRLHCEGGGMLLRALAGADLLDELYLTLCPRVFGGVKGATLTGAAGEFLPQSTRLRVVEMKPAGDELFLRLRRA